MLTRQTRITKFYRILLSGIIACLLCSTVSVAQLAGSKTFVNPILPSGADPWVIYKGGYYYYTNTLSDSLVIWKTKNVADLRHASKKTIWIPPPTGDYSHELWAPELHYLDHKWYMYFAADNGLNKNHRLFVLENSSADPTQGKWIFKGKLADATNEWAIDPSVFLDKGQLYLIWSGWAGDKNGEQDIYIAKMANPYTVEGKRVLLSKPEYGWEKNGDLHDDQDPPHVNVNEGPEALKHFNRIFLIYSASGCWTDFYALGMLSASASADLMDPKSWRKSPKPVFAASKERSVYAPGHNAFFKSPDGKEDWILYHANSKPGQGCGGKRSPRMQKFTWNKDGTPNFGLPVKAGEPLPLPSGSG